MPIVPTIMSPIVQESKARKKSQFFAKRKAKAAANNRCDSKKAKPTREISKPVTSRKASRYAVLEKLLSPGLSRRMRFRLAKEIDVDNYSPVHPCKLDVFSSPAVKISHFKNAQNRLRIQHCSLQKLSSDL